MSVTLTAPETPPPVVSDYDGDGIDDDVDDDDDGDGVPDIDDAFPLDETESVDTDGDGTGDNRDAFPADATESVDTDGDGTGNNADTDDDDDGMPDTFELANSLDPLRNDADGDADGDGATNLQEFQTGTDPNDESSIDACLDTSAVGPTASSSTLAVESLLYFAIQSLYFSPLSASESK